MMEGVGCSFCKSGCGQASTSICRAKYSHFPSLQSWELWSRVTCDRVPGPLKQKIKKRACGSRLSPECVCKVHSSKYIQLFEQGDPIPWEPLAAGYFWCGVTVGMDHGDHPSASQRRPPVLTTLHQKLLLRSVYPLGSNIHWFWPPPPHGMPHYPVTGLVDSGADKTILYEELFKKVAACGVPECLLMMDMCKLLGINKLNTTAYHPQCTGLTERFNRTLESMLRKHWICMESSGTNNIYTVLSKYTPWGKLVRNPPCYPIEAAFQVPTHTWRGACRCEKGLAGTLPKAREAATTLCRNGTRCVEIIQAELWQDTQKFTSAFCGRRFVSHRRCRGKQPKLSLSWTYVLRSTRRNNVDRTAKPKPHLLKLMFEKVRLAACMCKS